MKALIWDMDGVLLDSEGHYHKLRHALAHYFGVELSREISDSFRGLVFSQYVDKLSELGGRQIPLNDALKYYHSFLAPMYSEKIGIFPDAVSALESLKNQFPMGLASNTSRRFVDIAITRFSLGSYFKSILGGDQIANRKPAPDIFLQTARVLGVPPEECVVIEDSETGFRAAKAAGMYLIARKTKGNLFQDFSLADDVVENLSEVADILKNKRSV